MKNEHPHPHLISGESFDADDSILGDEEETCSPIEKEEEDEDKKKTADDSANDAKLTSQDLDELLNDFTEIIDKDLTSKLRAVDQDSSFSIGGVVAPIPPPPPPPPPSFPPSLPLIPCPNDSSQSSKFWFMNGPDNKLPEKKKKMTFSVPPSLLQIKNSASTCPLKSAMIAAGAGVAPSPPNLSPSCLLYTSPSPRDRQKSRMPSSA